MRRLHVTQTVSHKGHAFHIHTKPVGHLLNQAWQWLSTRAGIFNRMWAIKNGIAKELARAVLPEGLTMSRMYMSGSLRSWIHYCELRMANGTQKEHRELATQCWNIITEQFPSLKNVLENNQ